jgi:hypothetical protein
MSLLAPLQLPKANKGADGSKSGAQFLFEVTKFLDISANTTGLSI